MERGLFLFIIVGFINGGGWETMEERIWKEMMVVNSGGLTLRRGTFYFT